MVLTKKHFYVITLLFLLLPFSVHWRLLLFGGHTQGVVVKKSLPVIGGQYVSEDVDYFNIIRFEANGRFIEFAGPENYNFPIGKKFTIFYNKRNPDKFLLFSFYGLIFNNKMLVPFALFIFWIAFYMTIRQVKKK